MPRDVLGALERYTKSTGLCFVGADFRTGPNMEWVVLEVNPMPGYDSYDRRAGGEISTELLRTLQGGERLGQFALESAHDSQKGRSPIGDG